MSDQDEEKYKEELKAAGVDLPEEKVTPEQKAEAEAKAKEEAEAKEKADAEAKAKADADKAHLQDKKPEEPPRKRSIYDDYKEEKSDRKAAEARAQQAEKERDELQQKLNAATKEDADIKATDDAVAYAKKVGADPALVERIISDARKGFEPKTDESLRKDLEDFKAWRTSNSKVMEQQMFNDEFEKTVPSLKTLFPTITDDELKTVKKELDTLSHTKEWHDKSLDYVAFKHQDQLSKLVSPRRRGMESKGRKEEEPISTEFDPNADYSKMNLKEREAWEKQYKEFTKSDGLVEGANGKKILL